MNKYITDVKTARQNIGKKVFWDDVGSRYVMLRYGTLEDVKGKNVMIDGSWYWRRNLAYFRNFENGGKWEMNK